MCDARSRALKGDKVLKIKKIRREGVGWVEDRTDRSVSKKFEIY